MKIVINACFGGFGLSHKGIMKYAELKGVKLYAWMDDICLKHTPESTLDDAKMVHYATVPKEEYAKYNKLWHETAREKRGDIGDGGYFSCRDIERTDPDLIKTVEMLGAKANGRCAELQIIDIPDGTDWEIAEYDGNEHVAEKHQTWS